MQTPLDKLEFSGKPSHRQPTKEWTTIKLDIQNLRNHSSVVNTARGRQKQNDTQQPQNFLILDSDINENKDARWEWAQPRIVNS